jgi:hypothetical protein
MLMKRLRTVITDKKITMHSLRRRMKDKLRNSGCPENLSMEILGHAQGSVAANYGSGYAIEVMRGGVGKGVGGVMVGRTRSEAVPSFARDIWQTRDPSAWLNKEHEFGVYLISNSAQGQKKTASNST